MTMVQVATEIQTALATTPKPLTIADIKKSDLDFHLFSTDKEIAWLEANGHITPEEIEDAGKEWVSFFAYHDGFVCRCIYVYDGTLPLLSKSIRCIRPYTYPSGATRNP